MNTEVIIAKVKKYILIASVRLLSIISTSLANLLVIRPSGVVSKKLIGALSTRVIARFNMILLARVPSTVRVTENANISNAWVTPSAA